MGARPRARAPHRLLAPARRHHRGHRARDLDVVAGRREPVLAEPLRRARRGPRAPAAGHLRPPASSSPPAPTRPATPASTCCSPRSPTPAAPTPASSGDDAGAAPGRARPRAPRPARRRRPRRHGGPLGAGACSTPPPRCATSSRTTPGSSSATSSATSPCSTATCPVAAVTGALGRVMAAMLALAGLSAESMVRDDGWQFMEAGRRLERAPPAVRACCRPPSPPAATPPPTACVIESVLTSAESIITYRRRYRSHAQVETHARPAGARRRQPPVARLPGRPAGRRRRRHAATPRPSGARRIDAHRRRAGHPGRAGRHQRAGPGRRRRRPATLDAAARPPSLTAFLAEVTALLTAPRRRQLDRGPLHPPAPAAGRGRGRRRRARSSSSSRSGGRDLPRRAPHPVRATTSEVSASYGEAHLHPRETQGQQTLRRRRSPSTRSPSTTASGATSSATGSPTSPCSSRTGRSPSRPPRWSTSATGGRSCRSSATCAGSRPATCCTATPAVETLDARQFVLASPAAAAVGRRPPSTPRRSFAPGRPLVEALDDLCDPAARRLRVRARRDHGEHAGRRGARPPRRACARTSPTSPSRACAASASPRAT